jgi:hypothetical protein
MRRAVVLTLIIGTAALASGCAFTDATINVAYPEARAGRGALGTVPPRRIEIGTLVDRRPEPDKIGYKRNGFNQKTAKIQTSKPVPDIVREALAAELGKNGHVVGGADSELVLSGEISEFWFDISVGMWVVDFVGTTALQLELRPRGTDTVLASRRYRGYHKESAMGGLEGTWEHVMNTALEHMMRELSTDLALARALRAPGP